MQQELKDRIKNTLPQFVHDNLYEEHTLEANGEIIYGYIKSDDPKRDKKIEAMKDLLGYVTLKEVPLERLASEIQNRLELDEKQGVEVALIMLREIFYPVKDFFPGIDDQIIKLGGEIPKEVKPIDEQLLKREEEIEDMEKLKEKEEAERMADATITDTIDNLMAQFPELGDMEIGSQKSIVVKNMPIDMKPMIKYWIQDYKDKMGYYKHTNLDRVQYVCHDKNTRSMNEEERRQLNLVLKSADGEAELPYSTKRKKIDFSLVSEEE